MRYCDGKIIVTGGAGFIGSCVVRTLNEKGLKDIIIVDNIASTEKWRNISNKYYLEYIRKDIFINMLKINCFHEISYIWVHAHQQRNRILTICGKIMCVIQKSYGIIVKREGFLLFMQVLQPLMGMEIMDLMISAISII